MKKILIWTLALLFLKGKLVSEVNAEDIANELMSTEGYDSSMPTRLVACKAGSNSSAQALANSLGSSVYAASEDIFPPIKATTGQPALGEEPLTMEGPVEWKEFSPQNGGASTKTTQPKSQPPSSKPPVMPAPSASTSSTGSGTGEIY